MGGAAAAPAPAPAAPTGLEALLGGGADEAAEAAPAMATPAFLQAAVPAAAPAEAAGGDEASLLSRLLGSSLIELDSDINLETKS